MYVEALEYFPDPFTALFDKNMPVEILLKILEGFSSGNARLELAASLTIPTVNTFESVYSIPLEINKTIQGDKRNWDKVLKFKGSNKTFAQGNKEDNIDIWSKNYENLAQEFLKVYKK